MHRVIQRRKFSCTQNDMFLSCLLSSVLRFFQHVCCTRFLPFSFDFTPFLPSCSSFRSISFHAQVIAIHPSHSCPSIAVVASKATSATSSLYQNIMLHTPVTSANFIYINYPADALYRARTQCVYNMIRSAR